MSRCTAPRRGHHTASGRAACPVHGGGGYGGYGYSGYSSPSYSSSYSSPSYPSSVLNEISGSSGGGSSKNVRPRWSRSSSSVLYTPTEVSALTPVRETVEKMAILPEKRDFFLCHAWDDRTGSAKELHDRIESAGASVWFSEKDVELGSSLLREIDKGLANSRVGIVLVTPALLHRLPLQSIADKELAALLLRNRLVPILHGTTFDELSNVSPLLASRAGMSTAENTMAEIGAKLAELVAIPN